VDTDIQKSNDTYVIHIPVSGAETAVGIAQLSDIEPTPRGHDDALGGEVCDADRTC
jgi:hypothetical protein